jgi:hypothetical protein
MARALEEVEIVMDQVSLQVEMVEDLPLVEMEMAVAAQPPTKNEHTSTSRIS